MTSCLHDARQGAHRVDRLPGARAGYRRRARTLVDLAVAAAPTVPRARVLARPRRRARRGRPRRAPRLVRAVRAARARYAGAGPPAHAPRGERPVPVRAEPDVRRGARARRGSGADPRRPEGGDVGRAAPRGVSPLRRRVRGACAAARLRRRVRALPRGGAEVDPAVDRVVAGDGRERDPGAATAGPAPPERPGARRTSRAISGACCARESRSSCSPRPPLRLLRGRSRRDPPGRADRSSGSSSTCSRSRSARRTARSGAGSGSGPGGVGTVSGS